MKYYHRFLYPNEIQNSNAILHQFFAWSNKSLYINIFSHINTIPIYLNGLSNALRLFNTVSIMVDVHWSTFWALNFTLSSTCFTAACINGFTLSGLKASYKKISFSQRKKKLHLALVDAVVVLPWKQWLVHKIPPIFINV